MNTTTIAPGDRVRISKRGRTFLAHVTGRSDNGSLTIEPLSRGASYYAATGREVVCHWAARPRNSAGRVSTGPIRTGDLVALDNEETLHTVISKDGQHLTVETATAPHIETTITTRHVTTHYAKRGRTRTRTAA